MAFINYNGKTLDSAGSIVEAGNRGLRYGDGLFETIKMLNGKIVFEADHFNRLWDGLSVLQFEVPKHFSKAALAMSIKELAKKNNCEKAARIRINIFRGNGGLYDPVNHYPNYVIEAVPLSLGLDGLNSNGLVSGIYTRAFKSCDSLANLKHNNFLVYAMAAINAKKEKWNDAIVLNNHGRIADSTIANIFIVKNESVVTPALAEGCIAGVMRKNLISFLESNKWAIKETSITSEMLLQADEVFFTNSIYDIRWVKQIEHSTYTCNITKKIYNDFVPTIY